MFKKITLSLLAICLFSCSEKDENNKTYSEPFFKLSTGSLWVYKEYQSDNNGVLQFTNKIDSLTIPGDTIIEGNTYFKMLHEETGHYITQYFWRVDSSGHLVNENGVVMHPGTDKSYYTNQFTGAGTINYHLLDPLNITIEGNDYYVFPYHGEYVPLDPEAHHEYLERSFQKDLGMVTSHVSGAPSKELRLVSYHIN